MSFPLIAAALFIIAAVVAIWAVRRKSARPYDQRLEQDTAWNDPTTPADEAPSRTEDRRP